MDPSSDDMLSRVERPSRYLGGEAGSRRKDPATVDLTWALAFPDVYEVGMSHVGFPILYHLLNDLEGVAAERVYAPWPDMAAELRAAGRPLATLESGRPLGAVEVVGFTLQYELSYTNLLVMLDQAGIPRRQAARGADQPLVIAGGPGAFNPEPLADFLDAVLLGDGEEAVVEICAALRASRAAGETREQCLRRLAGIAGVYVPSLFQVRYHADGTLAAIEPLLPGHERVRRRILADLEAAPFPVRPVVPFMGTVHDRVAVEIARGCTRGCRFCQAGYLYRPVRERTPGRVAEIVDQSLSGSGYDEVSLLSLSTGDYSGLDPLLKGLMHCYAGAKVAVSLPSLRVGSLSAELMGEIRKVRKSGFTLAPEAGSERLRAVINKGISEEDLLTSTRAAFELGWRGVKLYFMLGLPTESDADLTAIAELAARVKKGARGTPGGGDVTVSVSTFVPKPHTPFQWEPQIGLAETRRRQALLRAALEARKLRLKWHTPELSLLEGVFARGDRRLGAVLERAVDLGCRFDGWRDHFRWDLWQQALTECELDPAWYLRARGEGELLPWDHLDCGVPKDFFLAERARAVQGAATDDCRGGVCHGCGVCDGEAVRMRLAEQGDFDLPPREPIPAAEEGERFRIRLRLAKTGRARHLGHLEFMALLHRAVRRAGLPLRYSGGFHPVPKISFSEALPSGLESEAEIVDLELYRHPGVREAVEGLNRELPDGVRVREGSLLLPGAPSPSASIARYLYELPLPPEAPADLERRLAEFLAAATVPARRERKGRTVEVDLRRGVERLALVEGRLLLELAAGSPVVLAAHLLGLPADGIRRLGLRKTAVLFR